MIKKLFILFILLLGIIFLIEFVLSYGNPFVEKEEIISSLKKDPVFEIETNPENFEKINKVFILSFLEQTEINKHLWTEYLSLKIVAKNNVKIADISHNKRFLYQTEEIEAYLKKYTPNTLLLHLSPAILQDVMDVPYFEYQTESKNIPVLEKEPEIAKSLKILSGNLNLDTFEIKPLDGSLGFKNEIPEFKSSISKKIYEHNTKMTKGIIRISNICQTLGIKFHIMPYPILWHSEKKDRYTQIPLNKILLKNGKPTLWYAQLYEESLKEIKKKIPKQVKWIDLYSQFPHDSRFFLDGFRLNLEGHEMFADMLHGRMKNERIDFEIF